jgi:rhomboid protease GluP
MFRRQTSGSVLCPSCGQLVGVRDEKCLSCGRTNPGLWGFSGLLKLLGRDLGFVRIVLWSCGLLYVCTLVVDPGSIRMSGLAFLSPGLESLFLFGASGAVPVFRFNRWWTVLSAAWLHGGLLHIAFNMLWVRDLGAATAHLYGGARTIIIYTVSAVSGFVASSLAGAYLGFLPRFLSGAGFTVGASAPVFGLLGALIYYGRRGGSSFIGDQAKRWALILFVFGFVFPGIDNWAHLGGLAGGFVTARWLDPLKPERIDHLLAALGCLGLSLASVLVSVVDGLRFFR